MSIPQKIYIGFIGSTYLSVRSLEDTISPVCEEYSSFRLSRNKGIFAQV